MENGAVERSTELESEDMTKHLEAEGYMNDGGVGHKRSLSGSLLSKLSFLRTTTEEVEAEKKPSESQASHGTRTGSMAAAVHEHRTRRRKGSLRKTALLGTGKLRQEHQTRPDHPQDSQSDFKSGNSTHHYPTLGNTVALGSRPKSNKGLGIQDLDYQIGPTRSIQLENSKGLDLLQTSEHVVGHAKPNSSPIVSPTSAEASTTDDDDMLSLPQQLSPNLIDAPGSSTASSSYLNLRFSSLQRRRSSQKPKSPLSLLAGDALAASDDEWDYTETAWWGWVVLAVTWIVFVVGMGSCLEVWSWAWDVGETPYAPPELEDDPTLPIVGYYPALIILTAVMSWVWVVVAWVGMKYFRHAKISGDDG